MDRQRRLPVDHSSPCGHRSRLRARFELSHGRGLLDYELLELLLTFALPRIDTKPLAKALLARFGGLSGVLGATTEELQQVHGVGPRAALLVSLLREVCVACLRDGLARRDVVKSSEAVLDYSRMALAGKSTEACLVLLLNSRNEILGEEVVAEGTVDRTTVFPRRVIEIALGRRAMGFVLIHNHPGGSGKPSPEDDALTRRLQSAAQAVELRLVDHLIVGRSDNFSYRLAGLL